jgi:D-alanyl-D-alanine carboxypeptidase/D-alanyl-D-alanine-endopeptidase (penicillin-binding protein 4)
MFAEALLKTMGAYDARGKLVAVGGYENGRAAVKKYLDRLGIDSESYVLDDGSGLSHGNRVTPAMITTILRHMNAHPRREEWLSNLAVPGEPVGTLRRRMKPLAGKVFAKTGSIGGVSALSGYVKADENRIYVFSILCNDTGKTKGMSPHTLQDDICRILAGGETTARGD